MESKSFATLNGPITQYLKGTHYLEKNKIPEIFQSLLAGLMLECPDDCMEYMKEKLELIKQQGLENISWDTFIKHLHPLRDPVRNKLIKDSDKLTEHVTDIPHVDDSPVDDYMSDSIDEQPYESELFHLTEPQDEDDIEDQFNDSPALL